MAEVELKQLDDDNIRDVSPDNEETNEYKLDKVKIKKSGDDSNKNKENKLLDNRAKNSKSTFNFC